jgi:hypothetical protein
MKFTPVLCMLALQYRAKDGVACISIYLGVLRLGGSKWCKKSIACISIYLGVLSLGGSKWRNKSKKADGQNHHKVVSYLSSPTFSVCGFYFFLCYLTTIVKTY